MKYKIHHLKSRYWIYRDAYEMMGNPRLLRIDPVAKDNHLLITAVPRYEGGRSVQTIDNSKFVRVSDFTTFGPVDIWYELERAFEMADGTKAWYFRRSVSAT